MTSFDIYVFILCFIVFTVFTALFTYVIIQMAKMHLKMIKNGLEDEEIAKQEAKSCCQKSCFSSILSTVVSLIICVVFVTAFSFSIYLNLTESKAANGIPSLKVVKSASMATVNEKNTYVKDNGLTDQIQTFDVVITRHVPAEEDLELYDIVVYEIDGTYVIHRIVGIEEPNDEHPDCRHFLLQGDAVSSPDQFPVLYSQMKGIYYGERIPFIGSFVLFMQSPAGWLCIILVLFAIIATPILEKKMNEAIKARLEIIQGEIFGECAPLALEAGVSEDGDDGGGDTLHG